MFFFVRFIVFIICMLIIQVSQIFHLLKRGVPQALANPRKSTKKSKDYRSKKIIRERLIRVARCYLCFIFLTCGHRRRLMDTMPSHWNPFPSLVIVSTTFGVDKSKKKNTDITDLARIALSRIFFFDIIFANDSWIYSGFCRIWSTLVLAASRRYQPMISATEHQPPLVLPRRGDAGYSC